MGAFEIASGRPLTIPPTLWRAWKFVSIFLAFLTLSCAARSQVLVYKGTITSKTVGDGQESTTVSNAYLLFTSGTSNAYFTSGSTGYALIYYGSDKESGKYFHIEATGTCDYGQAATGAHTVSSIFSLAGAVSIPSGYSFLVSSEIGADDDPILINPYERASLPKTLKYSFISILPGTNTLPIGQDDIQTTGAGAFTLDSKLTKGFSDEGGNFQIDISQLVFDFTLFLGVKGYGGQ